jgi:hypothetical protein
MTDQELVLVYKATGPLEAEVVKGRLETAGIPAVFDHESGGTAIGLTIDGWGEFRILVPASRADEARSLLDAKPE